MSDKPIELKTLEQIPAFRGFNAGECHQLMEIARQRAFAPGQRVIEQGKSSQYLWIVLEGQCEVVRDHPQDGETVLAELVPYNLFGEMSFFSPAPHSADVIARTPVRLLSISRADYDDLIRDGVTSAYKLAYNIVESVAAKLRQTDERLEELARHNGEPGSQAREPEWRKFREKLFGAWNL